MCLDDLTGLLVVGIVRLVRTLAEFDNRVNVHGKYARAIVGKERCKWTTHDLRAVDHRDRLAVQTVTVRQRRVVDTNGFEALDDGKGRAW